MWLLDVPLQDGIELLCCRLLSRVLENIDHGVGAGLFEDVDGGVGAGLLEDVDDRVGAGRRARRDLQGVALRKIGQTRMGRLDFARCIDVLIVEVIAVGIKRFQQLFHSGFVRRRKRPETTRGRMASNRF